MPLVSRDVMFLPCDDFSHGDFSSPIAFSLAKEFSQSPQKIAHELSQKISHPLIEEVKAIGGYLNIRMVSDAWNKVIHAILLEGNMYGHCHEQKNQCINLEYVSANPTGPLHGAHGRGAILGDVLANLLEAVGYTVVRENLTNDAGQQVKILAQTVLLHCEAIVEGKEASIPEGWYPGAYVKTIAQALLKQAHWKNFSLEEVQHFAISEMMKGIQEDTEALGVFHTVFTSERAIQKEKLVDLVVQELEKKGLVYRGTLPPLQGEEESPEEPLLLFRSSILGDEQDHVLQRSDGSWTYFASDIAYHWYKAQRGCHSMINIWGADHGGHVQRLKLAMACLTDIPLEIIVCQMVHFFQDGKAVKMSKRAGTFITIKEILSFLDKDILRFMMVTKKSETHLELDVTLMQEQTKENPLFYIQYAHARCCSILRAAKNLFSAQELEPSALSQADFSLIQEKNMIKIMEDWPRQVQEAANSREPHRLTQYLYKLSHCFHTVWHKGNQDYQFRFIQEDQPALSYAYVALAQATAYVIGCGLRILGMEPKKELR